MKRGTIEALRCQDGRPRGPDKGREKFERKERETVDERRNRVDAFSIRLNKKGQTRWKLATSSARVSDPYSAGFSRDRVRNPLEILLRDTIDNAFSEHRLTDAGEPMQLVPARPILTRQTRVTNPSALQRYSPAG